MFNNVIIGAGQMSFKKNSADFNEEEKMNDGHRKPTSRQKDYQLIAQQPLTNGISKQGLLSEGAISSWARKPTLDLAQQAQVAACTYLGVDPNETKYLNRIRQQGLVPDPFRPMEVHLHHHHHHYVDRFSKTGTGSHILGVDAPVSLGNSLSQSSSIAQSPKISPLSYDSMGLLRKSLQGASFLRGQVLDRNDLESTKFKSTLHMECKELSGHDVCSSKRQSISYPSDSSQQMTLTYKPFAHSNRNAQSANSSGFGLCTISDPSQGNIIAQTHNSSTKSQRPCIKKVPNDLTEDENNETLGVPVTSMMHGFIPLEEISTKEKKTSLTAEDGKKDDHACWSSAKNEIRNGATMSKRTEIRSKDAEEHRKNSHIAQKGAGTLLRTHFENQHPQSRKTSPVHSYLSSSVEASVTHDFTPSLEDIHAASSETAGEVMCRMKSQAPSTLNTHYFSQGNQIDNHIMAGEGGGWGPFNKFNKVNKMGDLNMCTDGFCGALHNQKIASSFEDIHVASPESLKASGEVIYMEKSQGSSVPMRDNSSPLSECKRVHTHPVTGEQEEWRSFVKFGNMDKTSEQILRSDGFMVALHARESVPSLEDPYIGTFETAVPAGETFSTENIQESPVLDTPHSSPLSGRHIHITMGAEEQGRSTHSGKPFIGDGRSDQILFTDEFPQKNIEALLHVDSFEDKEGPCRGRESKYETQQLMSGNKVQSAAEEKFYTSRASAKSVEDKIWDLMDEGASFHAECKRKLNEERGDKLQSHKVIDKDMSNEGSKEKRRIVQENIDGPVQRSKELFCKVKLQESLPISVGALQVEGCVSVKADEEAENAVQDEAYLSENFLKAAEDSLIEERACFVANFENELVQRSWNKHRSQQGHEIDAFVSEASELNSGDTKPKQKLLLMTSESFSPGSQSPNLLTTECAVLEINDDAMNKKVPAEMSSIGGNANVLRDSIEHAEEQLFNLLDEKARFHAEFEVALKQGSTGRLKLQELLEMDKLKHESFKKELERMKRNFELFWNSGLDSGHELKDTCLRESLPFQSLAREQEEERGAFERKACTCNSFDTAEAIKVVPNSLSDDKISELQQANFLHSSFCNNVTNKDIQSLVVEKPDKSLKFMPNSGWQDDNTAQIKSVSVSGEDDLDKSIIVDKAILAQGEVYESQVNSLHRSFEKIVHGFDGSEGLNMEMFDNDAASLEGDLQILKSAVRRLAAICHKQETKLAEFQNGKHLQSLRGKSYLTVLRDLYVNLFMDISKQLGSLNKDLKIGSFETGDEETEDILKQRLEKSETHVAALEKCLESKNEHIEETNRKLQAVQNETEAALIENFEFLHKIQAAQKENEEQKDRIKELVNINEELLVFAQGKESELNSLKKEIEKIQQMIQVKVKENINLAQELADTRKEMEELKDSKGCLKNRFKFLKSKLAENENELSQREKSIERLTKHLASTIEGQDCLLEEDEQLRSSLRAAQYKEQKLDGQLRQSHKIIEELQNKLNSMGSKIFKTRTDITDMKEQNVLIRREVEGEEQEAHSMQKEAGDMRWRVLQLEDEIMEKEGKIAILTSSYHEDTEF